MKAPSKVLKNSLFAGSLYFLLVSIVHFFEIKIPILFIYYNVPSEAYQDRIISFLSFGWAVFMFTAARDPKKEISLVKAILVAGIVAVLALFIINMTTDFKMYAIGLTNKVFMLETLGLLGYLIWLGFFFNLTLKQ